MGTRSALVQHVEPSRLIERIKSKNTSKGAGPELVKSDFDSMWFTVSVEAL